jgi:acetyl-CoA synthetase
LASAATPAPAGPSNDTEVLDELQAIYPPPKSLAAKAEVGSLAEYKRLWQKSIDDPAAFWGDLAEREFFWSKKWDDVFTR